MWSLQTFGRDHRKPPHPQMIHNRSTMWCAGAAFSLVLQVTRAHSVKRSHPQSVLPRLWCSWPYGQAACTKDGGMHSANKHNHALNTTIKRTVNIPIRDQHFGHPHALLAPPTPRPFSPLSLALSPLPPHIAFHKVMQRTPTPFMQHFQGKWVGLLDASGQHTD